MRIKKLCFWWLVVFPSFFSFAQGDDLSDVAELQRACETQIGTMIWAKGECQPLSVAKYAPLVYLAENEKFEPSSVNFFLPHVQEQNGFLVTKEPLGCPTCNHLPFFRGTGTDAPVYAIVTRKTEEIVDLTYWFFYPYNQGKTVCVGFLAGGSCVGCKKEFGDHVGDWEHITVRTLNLKPTHIYMSWHNSGSLFTYGDTKKITYEGTHPIVYSAIGSHGLYPKPGKFGYKKLFNGDELTDFTSKGKAWRSWENLDVILFKPAKAYDGKDQWMNFKGRWGNPKDGCGIYERLSGQCQLSEGPHGPVEKGAMTNLELD